MTVSPITTDLCSVYVSCEMSLTGTASGSSSSSSCSSNVTRFVFEWLFSIDAGLEACLFLLETRFGDSEHCGVFSLAVGFRPHFRIVKLRIFGGDMMRTRETRV